MQNDTLCHLPGGGGAADRVRVAVRENFFASSFLTDDAMVT